MRKTVYGVALLAAILIFSGKPLLANSTNYLIDPTFSVVGPDGSSTSFFGDGGAGYSAAANWTLFNNGPATIDTSLIASTFPGGSGDMISVTTTGDASGLVQTFLGIGTGPAHMDESAWVYVNSGCVGIGVGNGGDTGIDASTCTTGEWIDLSAINGVSPANEFIIYSTSAGASWDVAYASATTPEPASLLLLGTGLLGMAPFLRRRFGI